MYIAHILSVGLKDPGEFPISGQVERGIGQIYNKLISFTLTRRYRPAKHFLHLNKIIPNKNVVNLFLGVWI